MSEKIKTCGSCRHYIGGGDWNLCCELQYDLCYKDTVACNNYDFSQATIDRLEEERVKLARFVQKQLQQANARMEAQHGRVGEG